MTPFQVTIDLNPADIALEINESVGEDVETAESVGQWLAGNRDDLHNLMQTAVVAEIAQAYE